MPKAHRNKRKAPVTAPHSSGQPRASGSKTPEATRTTIRRFHVLIKRQSQLRKTLDAGERDAQRKTSAMRDLDTIEKEIEALGGLSAYQHMSTVGQSGDRGGGSEKVLLGWLRERGTPESLKGKAPLRLLEVGALKPDNYSTCREWIEATPIDLRSNHPLIKEQDFLLMDEEENRERWDIVSLSLVLNFVPDAKDRGRMLRLAHAMLRAEGLLFLALPLPCISNSRYLTPEHLTGLMEAIGYRQLHARWKEGGKMAYWLFSKAQPAPSLTYDAHTLYSKKSVLRQGNRNNFVVLL